MGKKLDLRGQRRTARLIQAGRNCQLRRRPFCILYTLRKKGTKAVTGAIPFQKVTFCPF